jgi:hypothetical protein
MSIHYLERTLENLWSRRPPTATSTSREKREKEQENLRPHLPSDNDQHVQRKKREKKKRICGHTCLSDSDKHVNTFAEGFLLCVRVGQ